MVAIAYGAGSAVEGSTQTTPIDSFDAEVAQILRSVIAPKFRAQTYSVTDYGADPRGNRDSLPAVRQAIAACNNDGGGRVLFPGGTWRLDGPIHLKSNVELHLADGARLEFTAEPSLFLPVVLTRWEGTEVYNYSPFIYAYAATNVAITGKGVIDGNARNTFAAWKPSQAADQQLLRKMGAESTPVVERIFGPTHFLRPNFIQFFACSNILIEDVTLVDAPFWCMHTVCSNNIIVRRVRIESRNLNNDGFDPESSSNILVEDCIFSTGDDGIAVKSGRDQDGWRVARPTENLVIRRCQFRADAGGVAIGSEMSGGVRNVFVEHCVIKEARFALNIKGNLDRGGTVEHIRIRDVACRDIREKMIQFTTAYHSYRGGNYPPRFRDVIIDGVTSNAVPVAISALGVKDAPLEAITIRNVTVESAGKSLEAAYYKDFSLENVLVGGTYIKP